MQPEDPTTPPQTPDQTQPPQSVEPPQDAPLTPELDTPTPPVQEQPAVDPTTPSTETPTTPVIPPVEQPVVAQPTAEQFPPSAPLQAPPEQPEAAAPQPQGENPGMTMGIIALVLTIIGVGLVGLILGIIALKKSKKAGFKNVPALISIILNIISVVIVIPILILLVLTTYSGVQERAKGTASQTSANSLYAQLESYNAQNDHYPTSISQLKSDPSVTIDPSIKFAAAELTEAPEGPSTLVFYTCDSGKGNEIGYWDFTNNQFALKKTFDLPSTASCVVSTT